MENGFKTFYYTYFAGISGIIVLSILLPYLDRHHQDDPIGFFSKYKLDRTYLSNLEVEVYKGTLPGKYVHILSKKGEEREFIEKESIGKHLDERLGITGTIERYGIDLAELLKDVHVTQFGSNINSEAEAFASRYIAQGGNESERAAVRADVAEVLQYHTKFRPLLISRASRLFQVVDFSYRNILFISVLHMLALILLGWFAVGDHLKQAAGSRIQTAGYLHTLIGFSAAILQMSGENNNINTILPYLGSALVTSILGWFLGGEIEERGTHRLVTKTENSTDDQSAA